MDNSMFGPTLKRWTRTLQLFLPLGRYAAYVGSCLPTFRYTLSLTSSRSKQSDNHLFFFDCL